MFKDSKEVIPYDDIDEEVSTLCSLMNTIPGVETVSSCFGHGKYPCMIWFKVDSIDTFSKFLFHFFNHERNWLIIADCGDPNRKADYLSFRLQSGDVSDEYLVNLMIGDLEARFINILSRRDLHIDQIKTADEFWDGIWK